MGTGSLQKAEEEREGCGVTQRVGAGKKLEFFATFCNRNRNRNRRGKNWECRKRKVQTTLTPPPYLTA